MKKELNTREKKLKYRIVGTLFFLKQLISLGAVHASTAAPTTSDGTIENFIQTIANFIAMLKLPLVVILAIVLGVVGYQLVLGDEAAQEKAKKGLLWKVAGFLLVGGALTWASIITSASAF